jgi:hypothetical protein
MKIYLLITKTKADEEEDNSLKHGRGCTVQILEIRSRGSWFNHQQRYSTNVDLDISLFRDYFESLRES